MGLQKGQSGYVFRWLMPVFALISSLIMIACSIGAIITVTGVDSFLGSILGFADFLDADMFGFGLFNDAITFLRFHAVFVTIIMIMMLALTIVGFVMNKKAAYIFGVVGGGIASITYLVKTIFYFWIYSTIKNEFLIGSAAKPILLIALLLMLPTFILSVCVCVFGAVAIPKCEYDKTIGERNIAGENLTYVGFENDSSTFVSNYHEPNPAGPIDPYAVEPEIIPDPVPVSQKPKQYAPSGPSGFVIGTRGMYRDAKFAITNNEELIIGRDPRVAQIVIGEGAQNVSRQHCCISYSANDNSYSVKDMSKNGTFSAANKSKLPHGVYTKVPAGTEIYLGDRSNMFRLG